MSTQRELPARETLLRLYESMTACRLFEDTVFSLLLTGTMPGTVHQYNGQEAVAAGVCGALRRDDFITSTHRGHGHYVAKGGDLNKLMAEMFAKDTGCCRGMGGSMHVADFSVGMLGATGIVGAGIPIAVGAALSCQLRGTDQVAVSFFGDGASNEGSFHEAINLAAVWKLPALFVCENNLYGFSTRVDRVTAVEDISVRAHGYGIPGVTVDGMDVLAVHQAAEDAVARARGREGPTLLECKTYRYKGHSRFEPSTYRTNEELQHWLARDPIPAFAKRLQEEGIASENDLEGIREKVQQRIDASVAYAHSCNEAGPDTAMSLIFAE